MPEEEKYLEEEASEKERQEEEERKIEEERAYHVEKYYASRHGYIPLYIIAPGVLLIGIWLFVLGIILHQTVALMVILLIFAIGAVLASIGMFVKASRIRNRRALAVKRVRRYKAFHPEREQKPVQQTIVEKQSLSVPEELMQWKKALDAGAITQEEFEIKKKQILGLK